MGVVGVEVVGGKGLGRGQISPKGKLPVCSSDRQDKFLWQGGRFIATSAAGTVPPRAAVQTVPRCTSPSCAVLRYVVCAAARLSIDVRNVESAGVRGSVEARTAERESWFLVLGFFFSFFFLAFEPRGM